MNNMIIFIKISQKLKKKEMIYKENYKELEIKKIFSI
jgi:hypothetical protein